MDNFEKINLWIIRAGAIFAVFTPLIITTSGVFPFVVGKAVFFRIIVEIILATYLILILYYPKYRPRFSWIGLAILSFLAVSFISAIFGANFSHSFWSNFERMEGLVTWLHLGAFFFIIANIFNEERHWIRLFQFLLGVSNLVSFYALLQALGSRSSYVFLANTGRASGTLGNSAYLGTYLIFAIFISLILLLREKESSFWRIFYGSTFVLSIWALFLSGTRGAVLGLGFGIMSFVLAYIFISNERKYKRYFWIALVVLIIFISVLIIFKDSDFIGGSRIFGRIVNISLESGTANTRLISWGISWNGWKDKFLFGWGPENYDLVFAKHFNPLFLNYGGGEIFDRAHNILFDVGVTRGVFGALAYFFIFATVLLSLWRGYFRKNVDLFFTLGISALIGAYLVQGFFVFDTISSYISLIVAFGFVHFVAVSSKNYKYRDNGNFNLPILKKTAVAVIILFSLFVFFKVSVGPMVAANRVIDGLSYNKRGEYDKGMKVFQKLLSSNNFGNDEARMFLIKSVMEHLNRDPKNVRFFKEYIPRIESEMEKTYNANPLNPLYPFYLGRFYNAIAVFNPAYFSLAEDILAKGRNDFPLRIEISYELAQTKSFMDKGDEAVNILEETVKLNSDYAQSHWGLGIGYANNGQFQEARGEFEEAISLGYNYGENPNEILMMADIYRKTGDEEKAELEKEKAEKFR